MRLELQRLVARGIDGLSQRVIVDLGAVLRHCREFSRDIDPIPELLEAWRRSPRDLLWVIAPRADGFDVSKEAFDDARMALEQGGISNVLTSTEPLGGLLTACEDDLRRPSVITAGIDERPYELWPLGHLVGSMLDVATGQLWTDPRVVATFGWPDILPELHAIIGAEPGEIGLGGRAARRPKEEIARVLRQDLEWHDSTVHQAVQGLVLKHERKIQNRAAKLRGSGVADERARSELKAWLALRPPPTTAYLVVAVKFKDDAYELVSASLSTGGEQSFAHGEQQVRALMKLAVVRCPDRWFVPRALDVLAAMVDRGLELPRSAIDPGLVPFLCEPDARLLLHDLAPSVELQPRIARWMQDTDRDVAAPLDVLSTIGTVEALDAALTDVVTARGLTSLAEDDIGPTLPVLARMEREGGAWVSVPSDYPSWAAHFASTEKKLLELEKVTAPLRRWGIDIYRSSVPDLVHALKSEGERVSEARWSKDLIEQHILKRLEFEAKPMAAAASEARRMVHPSGTYFWLKEFARGHKRLRGRCVPAATGRWTMRSLPLHGLPKARAIGKQIRSGLVPPPGHVLVGADQNAFELRLLADLSSSTLLLDLANKSVDLHSAIADQLFGVADPRTRKLAKAGMLAVMYGQDEDSFRRARFELTNDEATELHRKIDSTFGDLFAYQAAMAAQHHRDGGLRTRGGWVIGNRPRLKARNRARSIFNAIVQGLGADIQRWVLRKLAVALTAHQARVVHQAHDEIFVAVPEDADVMLVRDLLVETMTSAVMRDSHLLLHPVRLVATPHVGATWRDMF